MKKLVFVMMALVLIVGCSSKVDYGLGTYKDRNYVNKTFNLDFDVIEDFAFLTADELKQANDLVQQDSGNIEVAKYYNKVLDLSNTDGTMFIAFVDSTPDNSKNATKELNAYLDYLQAAGFKYSLEQSVEVINGDSYERADVGLDPTASQTLLVTVKDGMLLNIHISYHPKNVADVDKLIKMLSNNG